MGFVELNISGAAEHRKRKVCLAAVSGEAPECFVCAPGSSPVLPGHKFAPFPSPHLCCFSVQTSGSAGGTVLHETPRRWAQIRTHTGPCSNSPSSHVGFLSCCPGLAVRKHPTPRCLGVGGRADTHGCKAPDLPPAICRTAAAPAAPAGVLPGTRLSV